MNTENQPKLRFEFHCHTYASKDCLTTPKQLLDAMQRKGIDRLIVTDHNTIEGAVAARQMDTRRIIIGEEIMTTWGELLAFFIKETVPPGMTTLDTVQCLRKQGAFISISHPFDPYRGGWSLANLERIAPMVDAVEIFNSRCLQEQFNEQAKAFSAEHGLLGTVGSDAHSTFEIGQSTAIMPDFHDAESLKSALQHVEYDCKLSNPLVRLTSRIAVVYKKIFPKRVWS